MKSFKIGKIEFCVNNIIDSKHLHVVAPEKAYIIRNFGHIIGNTVNATENKTVYYIDDFRATFDYFKLFDVYASTGIVSDPLYNSGSYNIIVYSYKKAEGKFYIVRGFYINGGETYHFYMAFFVLGSNQNAMEEIKKLLVESVGDLNELRKTQREKKRQKQKGCIKRVFLEGNMLQDILDDMELFITKRETYEELGLPWKRGYLFYGPPGNGKTLTIRMIAKYFGIYTHDVLDCVDGGGNINLPTIHEDDELTAVADLSGCIVESLVDELYPTDRLPSFYYLEDLEKVVSYQSSNDDNPVLTLSSLLRALDGVKSLDGVVFIGTTNNIEYLADAVVARPGRIDRLFEFKIPNPKQISDMMSYHKIKVNGVDREKLVKWFDGMSFTFIEEFIKMSKFKSMSNTIEKDVADGVMVDIRKHNKMRGDLKHGKAGFEG